MKKFVWMVCGVVLVSGVVPASGDLIFGDVTANLTGTLFMDDAVTGGTDITVNEPSALNAGRYFDLDGDGTTNNAPGVAGTITISGFGFATSAAAAANDADTLTISVTYLGADEVVGGSDDVVIGSEATGYAWSGAGEYYVNFNNPFSAAIDGVGNRFQVSVAPSNATGDGSVRFKSNPLAFETFTGPKLSIAGSFVAIPEPSTIGLLGLAAAGLVCFRRR